MTVNRNNYEECFLLYADNELSKTERKIVEIFVQENPDLKEEFSMIKLTINLPDEKIKLFDKSFLLKEELSVINESNYEEIFVLYHDSELSEEQKIDTENFITKSPKYREEFELFLNSKLIPEKSIVYPGKKQLYRKEKSGKLIPMILWRSIAAAVFIGFGLWGGVSYFKKNDVVHTIANSINIHMKKPAIKEAKPDTNIVSKKTTKEDNNIASSTKATEPGRLKKNKKEIKRPAAKEQKIKDESIAVDVIKTKNEPTEKIIKTPRPYVENQLAVSDNQTKKLTDIVEKTYIPLEKDQIAIQGNKIKTEAPNITHVQRVSYNPDAIVNNQNYVFYDVTADEFNKSKVGGFLKKVRRVVERSNPITRLLVESDLTAK